MPIGSTTAADSQRGNKAALTVKGKEKCTIKAPTPRTSLSSTKSSKSGQLKELLPAKKSSSNDSLQNYDVTSKRSHKSRKSTSRSSQESTRDYSSSEKSRKTESITSKLSKSAEKLKNDSLRDEGSDDDNSDEDQTPKTFSPAKRPKIPIPPPEDNSDEDTLVMEKTPKWAPLKGQSPATKSKVISGGLGVILRGQSQPSPSPESEPAGPADSGESLQFARSEDDMARESEEEDEEEDGRRGEEDEESDEDQPDKSDVTPEKSATSRSSTESVKRVKSTVKNSKSKSRAPKSIERMTSDDSMAIYEKEEESDEDNAEDYAVSSRRSGQSRSEEESVKSVKSSGKDTKTDAAKSKVAKITEKDKSGERKSATQFPPSRVSPKDGQSQGPKSPGPKQIGGQKGPVLRQAESQRSKSTEPKQIKPKGAVVPLKKVPPQSSKSPEPTMKPEKTDSPSICESSNTGEQVFKVTLKKAAQKTSITPADQNSPLVPKQHMGPQGSAEPPKEAPSQCNERGTVTKSPEPKRAAILGSAMQQKGEPPLSSKSPEPTTKCKKSDSPSIVESRSNTGEQTVKVILKKATPKAATTPNSPLFTKQTETKGSAEPSRECSKSPEPTKEGGPRGPVVRLKEGRNASVRSPTTGAAKTKKYGSPAVSAEQVNSPDKVGVSVREQTSRAGTSKPMPKSSESPAVSDENIKGTAAFGVSLKQNRPARTTSPLMKPKKTDSPGIMDGSNTGDQVFKVALKKTTPKQADTTEQNQGPKANRPDLMPVKQRSYLAKQFNIDRMPELPGKPHIPIKRLSNTRLPSKTEFRTVRYRPMDDGAESPAPTPNSNWRMEAVRSLKSRQNLAAGIECKPEKGEMIDATRTESEPSLGTRSGDAGQKPVKKRSPHQQPPCQNKDQHQPRKDSDDQEKDSRESSPETICEEDFYPLLVTQSDPALAADRTDMIFSRSIYGRSDEPKKTLHFKEKPPPAQKLTGKRKIKKIPGFKSTKTSNTCKNASPVPNLLSARPVPATKCSGKILNMIGKMGSKGKFVD